MTEVVKKQYNYCMDFLKGIACIFVVFIHVKFPGDFGQAVQAVARFAVPFFFMVSGYYCYRKDYQGVKVGGKKIWHILKITFFAYLFYIVVALLDNWLLGGTKTFNFTPSHLLFVVIYSIPYNVPPQLWFLIALLEVYIVYFFIDLLHARKLAYIAAVITFIAMILFSQSFLIFGKELGPDFYRNAWIEGYSFFTLGYFLHDKKDKLNINNKALISIIIFLVIVSVVERFGLGRVSALHISTYPLVISLFIYAINNSEKHAGAIQQIGKKYSMYVYILHIFFWIYMDKVLNVIGWSEQPLALWFRPLIVLFLTVLASMGCYALFNRKKEEQIISVNTKK